MPRRLTGRGTAGHLGGEKAQAHGSHVAPHVARVRPPGGVLPGYVPTLWARFGLPKAQPGTLAVHPSLAHPSGAPQPVPMSPGLTGMLTRRAADGDDAAAGGAEQGQQPLGELQRAEEVHLHAGAEVAQRRELRVRDDVVEAGVVHQTPETWGKGDAQKSSPGGTAPRWGCSPTHGNPAQGATGCLGTEPLAWLQPRMQPLGGNHPAGHKKRSQGGRMQ